MPISEAPPSVAVSRDRRRLVWSVCAVLVVLTLLIFGQAAQYGFVALDDDVYVDRNPALTVGLSAKGMVWAFTTNLTKLSETAEYWQPLTSISRLADYQAYGFKAGGHHFTSVLVHLATGLALFGALYRLTGRLWRSAFVAALFLVHPMHVEPVLWLSARKDLVNGLFFVLTLWAYGWYSAEPGWRRYLVVFAAALAANMGKPMAVSLPFVLLLLDFWSLRRVDFCEEGWLRRVAVLVFEKIPLFVLTFGVAILAYIVQKDIGALAGADVLPLPWRLANVAVAVCTYVAKMFVPVNLTLFYPHPGKNLSVWLAGASAFGILLVCWFVLRQARGRPWLAVGWFWFLVVLAPVSGIVQIGDQAMADRYSYLSFIGLFVAVTWQGADWMDRWKSTGNLRPAQRFPWMAGAVVIVFSILSFFQVQTWRSSETAFRHALATNRENYLAHFNLGGVLWDQGRRAEAMEHFNEAARIREPFLRFQLAAANLAIDRGDYREAIPRLVRVLMIRVWDADLHFRLGSILALNNEPGKALVEFQAALKYRPDWDQPRISIAAVLLQVGEFKRAEKILQEILARDAENAEAKAMLRAVSGSR